MTAAASSGTAHSGGSVVFIVVDFLIVAVCVALIISPDLQTRMNRRPGKNLRAPIARPVNPRATRISAAVIAVVALGFALIGLSRY